MIVGLGSDVASIQRIGEVLERHGERFVNRVLTPAERARYQRTVHKAAWLAKRWAAKEAFSKAIGTGIHAPFTWHSITVGRDAKGKPLLQPDDAMRRHLDSMGVSRMHITLTDDADVAFAVVVLEAA